MPENKNEMLMEDGIEESQNINIGDTLEIDGKQIKIVGSALSTDFLIRNKMLDTRGTSSLGAGRVSFCLFATKDYFDFDYYTTAYIVDENIKDYNIASSEYQNSLIKDKELLNELKGKLEEEKYKNVISEATQKIDEEAAKAYNELDEAKTKLDNAKLELDEAKEKLDSTKNTLDSSKRELDDAELKIQEYEGKLKDAELELNQGKEKLDDAKKTLDNSKKELDEGTQTINNYEQELLQSKQELDNKKTEVNDFLAEYDITFEDALNSIHEAINVYGSKEQAIATLANLAIEYNVQGITEETITEIFDGLLEMEEGYDQIAEAQTEIETQKQALESAKETYNEGLQQYNEGLEQYNINYAEYEKNKNEFEKQKENFNTAKRQYNEGLKQYNEGLQQYNDGLNEYNNGLEEYNNQKIEVEQKIKDARKELESIEKATFYISDRNENYEYDTYMSLCKSFDNLSKTFPVIFIFVTIFVSLLSMARMAIENRTEIGTLKALGFKNKEIRVKFIIYSLLATLLGGIIGAIVGNYVLSYLCYEIFNSIYQVPVYESTFNITACIVGNLFAILAIVGATLIVINQLLKRDATTLLRPYAPPVGKKIWLEKIKPLWNRFSFSNKIMARNIFRYKRRVIMSLLGFIGCTSLLIAGYAIRDSMINIIDKQYIEISDYDYIVNVDGNLNEKELNKTFNYNRIDKMIYVKTALVEMQDTRATFIIPNDINNFRTVFNLKDYKTGEVLDFKENEIIITVNLAQNLHKKVGDKLEFIDSNNVLQTFKISAIAENYVDNYIYMDKQTYADNIDQFFINCAFLKFDSLEDIEGIITNLNKNEHILTIVSMKDLQTSFKTMLGAFDNIILLLIIFSALLSFVVMYSLAYITISERQKEIATLQVLGYSQKEVDKYILKEQLNIVVLGIILGIIIGNMYSAILVKNINFNQLYLVKQVEIASYLKTAGFISLFAFIVGIVVHFMLKKIKMMEALKSIE